MITYESNFNCSHYAVGEINRMHNADITVTDGEEWQVDFIRKLKREFVKIDRAISGCLVVMTQSDNSLHLGVYRDFAVWHNFNPMCGAGMVIGSDLGTIRAEYRKVRFYKYDNH